MSLFLQSNNKCVFSAATSSVQTFRLGKSIASERGEHKGWEFREYFLDMGGS
jgi:hypothetical protein